MKLRTLIILLGLLLITGCSHKRIDKQHDQYLSNKGWDIQRLVEVETYILDIPDEILRNYEASGITFIEEYVGKEVVEYSYKLKQKDIEGERLKAILIVVEEEIVGGYGILPSWTPGIFSLDDKNRLINENMISQ
ncbi:DUF4830 domain-containing protein [Bacillus niameyensis]|uniref:DUF4830 domain-containing protein n=1 Tax=Bacillus niameyensis TaxID=1522308 RepID=UPI0007866F8E|nr:DUF4830 domain-containing protein [Bacillus niameyensis]